MIESFFRAARNQSGYWLHAGRLRGYSVVIIVVYVLSSVAWIATSEGLVDPTDKPLGYDFIAFFSASKIALGGDFVAVFDQMQLLAVQQEVIPGNRSIYTWNYPPQFLVVVLPLALLPYSAAFFAWTGASLWLYLLVVHRFAPSPITRLLAAAAVAWVWMREAPTVLKAAVLVAGAPLAPPYVFDYDLVILAIPIAIIAWAAPILGLPASPSAPACRWAICACWRCSSSPCAGRLGLLPACWAEAPSYSGSSYGNHQRRRRGWIRSSGDQHRHSMWLGSRLVCRRPVSVT